MMHDLVTWLVATIGTMGYPGIIFLMFLESSFFPFPSEVVIPPAGYLAHQGEMNIFLIIIAGIGGSLMGALFNYWISITAGRAFFEKYGKYFFISTKTLDKSELFFRNHGHISTFIGRLIPGIRQYISLPAGVSRMNLRIFCLYTALGAGIWVVILALAGYWFGENSSMVMKYLHQITIVTIGICFLIATFYIIRIKKKKI